MATNSKRLPPAVEAVTGTDGLEYQGRKVDLRSRQGRQWRDHIRHLAEQLTTDPTPSQGILLRRAATFCILVEAAEAQLLAGEKIDEANYRANADKLKAILVQIGLAQKSRDVTGADQKPADDHAAMILGQP